MKNARPLLLIALAVTTFGLLMAAGNSATTSPPNPMVTAASENSVHMALSNPVKAINVDATAPLSGDVHRSVAIADLNIGTNNGYTDANNNPNISATNTGLNARTGANADNRNVNPQLRNEAANAAPTVVNYRPMRKAPGTR